MERWEDSEISGYNKRMNQLGGYGIVYRKIMRCEELPIDAKAIYAYLCSFAGSGNTCYPSAELMCKELGISPNRFYRQMKILTQMGVVKKTRERNGNRMGGVTYTISHSLMGKPLQNKDVQNEDVQNEDVQNEDVQNQRDGNICTNNNSTNSNSLKNIKEYYELIYSAYPRKGTAKEKESSFHWFKDALNNSGYCFEQLYEAVKAFCQDSNKIYPDKRSIPGISYFFTERMYEKYLQK